MAVACQLPSTWARIRSIFASQRWILLGAVLFMAIVAATEVAIPAFTKKLLDTGFGNIQTGMLWQVPAVLISLACVRGLAQFTSQYFLNLSANNILFFLREKMFSRMVHASTAFFEKHTVATLINALVFEVNQVLQIFSNIIISLVRDSLTVAGLLIYLFYLNWHLTLVVAIALPPIGLLMSRISKRLRHLNRSHQTVTNDLAYVVEEACNGYKVVKIHGAQAYEQARFSQRAKALRGYAMRMAVTNGLNQPITQLLAVIALSIVIAMAMLESTAQQITVGGFTAFIMAMMLMISPLKRLADINQPLQRGLIAAEMIFRLLDEPDETEVLAAHSNSMSKVEREGEEPHSEADKVIRMKWNWNHTSSATHSMTRAQGAIAFKNISFFYTNNRQHQALSDINLLVQPGQTIALVGPSGSGKTTLANLIPRFLTPQQGSITLDGIDIAAIKLADLRQQIAFVSQDVVLFNDTIAANIAYGAVCAEEIDYDRVEKAIYAAYLTEVVSALPQGINSVIGDKGNQLSGGQRQRLAIARAIYKNAPILILDEATSALDSESERQVQAALAPLMRNCTTLVIAHRLSTIEQADQIIVLDHGKIVEQGTHKELLTHNQLYANLYRTQFQEVTQ